MLCTVSRSEIGSFQPVLTRRVGTIEIRQLLSATADNTLILFLGAYSPPMLFFGAECQCDISKIPVTCHALARAFLLYSPARFIDNKYLHSAIVDLTTVVLFAPHRSCGHRTFGHRNFPCHATGDIYLAIAEDCGVKVPLGLPSAHGAKRMTTGFCTDFHTALSPWWIPSSSRGVFGGQIKVQENGIRIVGKAPNYWP